MVSKTEEIIIDLSKTLCKQCVLCSTHEYSRTDKRGKSITFLYCNANAEQVHQNNWNYQTDGYVCDTKTKNLFHTLFKKNKDNVIDHENGDRVDNRLCNLRDISQRENLQNLHFNRASEYPGVIYHKHNKKWTSKVYYNGKRIYNKYYDSEEEAFHMYVMRCNELGIPINTEIPVYRKYLSWLNRGNVLEVVK
jgi:hypothetical protein